MSAIPGPLSSKVRRSPRRAPSSSDFDGDRAAAAVLDGVARQLARRGHDLGLIDQVEPELDGPLPHRLADRDDVLGVADRALHR